MNAPFAPLPTDPRAGEMMTFGLAMALAGSAMRGAVAARILNGDAPKSMVHVFLRQGRLYAVVEFEGSDIDVQIPLDVWPPGARR